MGKRLIIKGADFSANSIDTSVSVDLFQGYFVTNPSNQQYGTFIMNSESIYSNCTVSGKVLIPAGKTATIKVFDNGVEITSLFVSGIFATGDVEIRNGYNPSGKIGNIYPSTTAHTQTNGDIVIANTYSTDTYFYFSVAQTDTFTQDTPLFSVVGKMCSYKY